MQFLSQPLIFLDMDAMYDVGRSLSFKKGIERDERRFKVCIALASYIQ